MKLQKTTVEGWWEKPCVYCGANATQRDHFVPRSYRAMIENWRSQKGWGDVPDTVPACAECNATAGPRVFATISDKRAAIHDRYRHKYARLLSSPFWTQDELAELGYALRSRVEGNELKRLRLLLRLSWPYDPADEIEALTLSQIRRGGPADAADALNRIKRREILRWKQAA